MPDNEKLEYQEVVKMIKELDKNYDAIISSVNNGVNTLGYNEEVVDDSIIFTKEEVENMEPSKAREFLSSYILPDSKESFEEKEDEEILSDLSTIKSANLLKITSDKEREEIKESAKEIYNEYFNYMSSNKVNSTREKELATLKESLEFEKDEVKKKRIERKIALMEHVFSYEFIFDRLEGKYADKEAMAIFDGFFENKKGGYDAMRFQTKLVQFGFSKNLTNYFLNLEENFLPEEYHPFNNVFFYGYMRMMAHADRNNTDDSLKVSVFTGAIANLIYHRFDSKESEDAFINIIKRYCDDIKNNEILKKRVLKDITSDDPVTEYFKLNNTTWKESPSRKVIEEETLKKNKEFIVNKMKKYGMEVDESKDLDTLVKELRTHINTLKEDQIAKYKEETENKEKVINLTPDGSEKKEELEAYTKFEDKAYSVKSAIDNINNPEEESVEVLE